VAEQQTYLGTWKKDWDDKQCSVRAANYLPCSIMTVSGTFTVKTVSINLKIPTSPKATGYIGTPPSEIRQLYAATQQLADAAEQAGANWSASCESSYGAAECGALVFKFSSALDALDTKFSAWKPYM